MANGKRYYWLKLHDDFFASKRIKKLRKIAGGDTYTIIYLKMQLLAMKSEGVLKWTGLEDNMADELALDLDESPDDVKMTLAYLLSCGLAETSDDISYFFPYAVSNTGSEVASAQRVRDHRARQKLLQCNEDVTPMKQIGNGEKEIETRERERDRDRDSGDKSPRTQKAEQEAKPYKHIVDYLNAKAGTQYKASCKDTKAKIDARLAENFTVTDFETVIDKKCEEWRGTEWEKFLRPLTLFGPKFESYLNAKIISSNKAAPKPNRARDLGNKRTYTAEEIDSMGHDLLGGD